MKKIADGFAFARDRGVLEGTLPVRELGRLHDLLTELSGELAFRLQGRVGTRGEPMLHVAVSGVLPLICQRCLESISFDLCVDTLLELVPEGSEMSQDELEDDTRDFLPVVKALNVVELLEDEVLLALPVAPRHEKCGLPGLADAGERVQPFAVLASLKGKPN